MIRPWKRLTVGLGLLGTMALLVAFAATSAFAYTIGTDQPNTANSSSPANSTGSISVLSMRPASAETFGATYTFSSTGFASVQQIDTMYQQWRHVEQNDWFYLYARNINDNTGAGAFASAAAPSFAAFYYAPGRGATLVATGTSGGGAQGSAGTTVTSNTMSASTIYLDSGTGVTNPAFIFTSFTVYQPVQTCTTACTASFITQLNWGMAQQGFRRGSFVLMQAVESAPISTSSIGQATVYYDGWESPTGSANTVTLNTTNPGQSATGVTNATGTRQANLSVPYTMDQTVTDSDGDLNNQSIVWVFTSGNQVGQWFEAGLILNRLQEGQNIDTVDTSATGFYQDWRTAPTFFATGAGTTVGYFTQLTIFDPASADTFTVQTTNLHQGNATGVISQTTRYSFIYGTDARGGVTLYGRAGDWHGGSSGNVQVGTQTIT